MRQRHLVEIDDAAMRLFQKTFFNPTTLSFAAEQHFFHAVGLDRAHVSALRVFRTTLRDGFEDVALLSSSRLLLYRNAADGTFTLAPQLGGCIVPSGSSKCFTHTLPVGNSQLFVAPNVTVQFVGI